MLECVAAEALYFAATLDGESQIRIGRLLAALQRPVVDILQLRGLVLVHGLPPVGTPSLRALVWKLLLGVLPAVRSEWFNRLAKCRSDYADYVRDLVAEPEVVTRIRDGHQHDEYHQLGPVTRVPVVDHPLALSHSVSPWRSFWTDSEIFDQVNKDVFRTRVETDFFHQTAPADMAKLTIRIESRMRKEPGSPKSHSFVIANIMNPSSHYDRICRLLFLFSKLNFGYIQGMNELIAPLYWTFVHDSVDGQWAEADTFYAFTAIMIQQRDIFTKTMDDCHGGILGRIEGVKELLEQADPVVFDHLKKHGVRINFFALRWILLLFAQEFDLVQLQQIWDALLADDDGKGSSLVAYICVAMILLVREVLLAGTEFGDILQILQRYPPFDPAEILALAKSLRDPRLLKSSSAISSDDLVLASLNHTRSKSSFRSVLRLVRESE